ncbi:hypothetical protein SLA2020_371270 [Shorea laevis]
MYTEREIGFSGLIYPEAKGLEPNSAGVCQNLSLNTQMVAGKVVLCFTSVSHRVAIISAAATVREDGGFGLIIAKSPSDALSPCGNDFPCIEVDSEIGTRILFYIRSVRSPIVKLSPSKTLVGKPVSPNVAFFSSRGPSSIAPEILKPDITVPGVNILAATSPDDWLVDGGYAIYSDTSMETLLSLELWHFSKHCILTGLQQLLNLPLSQLHGGMINQICQSLRRDLLKSSLIHWILGVAL